MDRWILSWRRERWNEASELDAGSDRQGERIRGMPRAKARESDEGFTLSRKAESETKARAVLRSESAGRARAIGLDDLEEFREARQREANDARARAIGNVVLVISFVVQIARGEFTRWRRRRKAREEAERRAREEADARGEATKDDGKRE